MISKLSLAGKVFSDGEITWMGGQLDIDGDFEWGTYRLFHRVKRS